LIRAVFDTNILLSAFLSGENPRELFELARAHAKPSRDNTSPDASPGEDNG